MRPLTRLGLVPLFVLLLSACGGPSPADELDGSLRVLTSSGIASVPQTRTLYAVLDRSSAQAVDARAAALSAQLGRPVQPYEAIQFRGFAPNARLEDVDVTMIDDDHATLHLKLAKANSSVAGMTPEPVDLKIVREDGQWKIVLPELIASLAQTPAAKPVTP